MNEKEFRVAVEMILGLLQCNAVLAQYLIRHNIVKKTDLANAIDFLIDHFNARNPSQSMTLSMSRFREELEKVLPDFPDPPPQQDRPKNSRPDWFRGLIDGGKS